MSSIVETHSVEHQSLRRTGSELLPQCAGARMDQFVSYTFPQLFEEQVKQKPDQPAVISGKEQLSYSQLNSRANRLAGYLRQQGIEPETIVGVCIDRSLDMAVAILGILKSGAAYLPLDPEYPAERLTWMAKDSGVAVVLTKQTLASDVLREAHRLVFLDADAPQIARQPDENLADGPNPNDLAYVIYTSGSTGEPKGVMINHSSLANYLLALEVELNLNVNDRYLHTASVAFSSSRRQLLLPLSQGATVVIASSEERKDPLALFATIKQREVTVMDAVPSFWRNSTQALSALDPKTRDNLLDNRLRLMISASEPLLSDIPHTWNYQFGHRARHIHMFGQTETAGIVSVYKIPVTDDQETHVVPVGRPIANSEIYILDEHLKPAPPGAAGEMYIGGAGVGRGYLNRPDLTAEKFVAHPFSDKPNARLYRTGDWARYRHDGQIEFVGRQDSQVKLRGFRVELGEVEGVLARHSGIQQNAVVALESNDGTKRLVAYFVSNGPAPTVTELRAFLSARLPDYMVPSTFVELAAFPLTANGKFDRRALPTPEDVRPELDTRYEAPQTTTQRLLEKIWNEVLQLKRVGVADNFFELGGHSLLAIQAVARVNQQLKIEVPLRVLFDGPTIKELAEKIDLIVAQGTPSASILQRASREQKIPLSSAQQRFWFLDQLEPGSSLYIINRALRINGHLDLARLEHALELITERHESLRTTFVARNGLPEQIIFPTLGPAFHVHDLRPAPADSREEKARQLLRNETEKPFDLSRGPLLRLTVIRLAEEECVLLLSLHHIIGDAWSVKLFFQELARLYQESSAEVSVPELPIQCADFACWQRSWLDGQVLEQQLSYWTKQLKGAPPSLDLPTDHLRPATPSGRGAEESISLSEPLAEMLKDLSRREGVTLFMSLIAVFQTLLRVYSGQDDVSVGIPVAGRTLIETESLIGCFVNTLVVRGDLSGNPTLRELIKRTREVALGAYTNQDVPFERLVKELRPERGLASNPLFQVMFVLQDRTKPELSLPGCHVSWEPVETTTSKFDLALAVIEKEQGLDVCLSYSTDIYDRASMRLMIEDFKLLLESIVASPDQRLSDLPAMSWRPGVCATGGRRDESQQKDSSQLKTTQAFLAPRTPIEERLAGIWSEILSVERVGVTDNFFDLGGHSLLAAQVVSRTRNLFSVELPLRRLFESPTIAGLAEAIYEMQTAETGDEELAAILAELNGLSEEEAELRFASR